MRHVGSSARTIQRAFRAPLALVALALSAAACGRSALDDADLYGAGQGGAGGAPSGAGGDGAAPSTTTATSSGGNGPGGGGGAGGSEPCATPQDCDDGDVCTTDLCQGGQCFHKERDDDADGWIAATCGGDDCNDLNPNANPATPEICDDASDNDCNGVADCFDPACEGVPDCGCTPEPNGESCQNGKDDDCDTTVDCLDTDCIGTPACGCAATEGSCVDGFDADCDGAIDCDDPECAGNPTCQCQAIPESCLNGEDDDCDLLVDCLDPDCDGIFPCACVPPGSPEQCGDTIDNDCDELPDCADPECIVSPLCATCTTEICDDGEDNSCDGKIDCADPACAFAPNCEPTAEICNNGLDDDNDTLTDCKDPDCANNPKCVLEQANCLSPKLIPASGTYVGDTTGHTSETKGSCGGDAGEAVFYFVLTQPSKVHLDTIGTSFDSTLYVRTGKCNSGKELACDDDSAGNAWAAKVEFTILYPGTYYVFVDGYTVDPELGPNEGPFALNVDIVPNPPEVCGDGLDNDGDHYVDCADPECAEVGKCKNCNAGSKPGPEFGMFACTNGLDDDCDGVADCADDDCSASDYYVTECCDGADENDNGIPDDFNCRCASGADCGDGQICYTHTAYACGIPCDAFFGDVCPFVAPGSYCNPSTHQCEF